MEMTYEESTKTYNAEIQKSNLQEIKLIIRIHGVPFVDNPPTIEYITWHPKNPTGGEEVTVIARVSDDYGVNIVILSYYDGSWHNVTMTYDREENAYYARIPGYSGGTTIKFRVYANDTSGNWTISNIYQVTFTQVDTGGQPTESESLIFIGVLVSVILLISILAIKLIRMKRR